MNPVNIASTSIETLRYGVIVCERYLHDHPSILALAIAVAAMVLIGGCTAVRTVVHNFADLDDHTIFANRAIERGAETSPLRTLSRVPRFVTEMKVPDEQGTLRPLDEYLDETSTAAFVVMRDDRIVYERYSRGFEESSLLNSFSIAKSILATLVGIAVSEGRIASLDATVADYRPDFAATPYGAVTLRSLLAMTSGMGDRATLLPGRAQYYYGDDLHQVVEGSRPEARPANGWRYSEADVQVLGFVLEAAVGKSVSAYLSEKLWKPLGMESAALWAMDREGGMEKTFCCISARARDFARFGRLYLENGRWNGEQIVPASWASRSVVRGIRTPDGYTHQHFWWAPEGGEGDYYAYGHNGQYVYVNPAAGVVIVKFSETNRQDPLPMFRAISSALKSPERVAELDRLAAKTVALRP
jgi:CubicO group peptidase (beta-lactamase class C family)